MQYFIKFIALCSILFCSNLVVAQPGGGGGLCIAGFYDKKGNKINIFEDKNIKIRTFALKDGKVLYESLLLETQKKDYKHKQAQNSNFTNQSFCLLKEIEGLEPHDKENHQRLWIKYKGETLILDLFNIMGENGMGNHDKMDSLVIQSGHFIYDRNSRLCGTSMVSSKQILSATRAGFTLNNQKILLNNNILKINKNQDKDFILDKNLSHSYFVHKARVALKNKQPQVAYDALQEAISRNKNEKDCNISLQLCEYYTQTKDYNQAIAQITDALDCRIGKYAAKETNYYKRISLYLKTRQYREALADYNTIIDLADEPFYDIMERTYFKIKYMKDYASAAKDMEGLLIQIQKEERNESGFNENFISFSRPFYALAQAEYGMGKHTSAAAHYLRAMECGLGRVTSTDEYIKHLDTLIQRHPLPDLYVARGLAYHGRSQYLGWGEATMASFAQAVTNFDRAESLGFTDYRINLYRAQSLRQLKKYPEALDQINIAIQKNNQIAICYGIRYDIRQFFY